MREAVAQMKQELGENAVILHTKKYKDGGFLGVGSREMIELTAAIEDEKPVKKELKTEKIETPTVKVRPPTVVSQYKTSGTPEGLALAEKTQTPVRSTVEGVREAPPVEPIIEEPPAPLEIIEPVEEIVEEPVQEEEEPAEDNYIEEPPDEEEEAQAEEPPVERNSTSELLTAAMNIASSSEPVPQPESEPQAAPLPTELSNLTATGSNMPMRSEQLTAAPPTPAPTVTLTTDQLAQMQAAMVAQTVAQLQMNTVQQPASPAPTPAPVEPPKSEAVASSEDADADKETKDEERSEAERLSEEKIRRLEDEIAQMKAMLAKVLGRDITRGMISLHEALRQQEVSDEILNDMAVTAGAGDTLADSQSMEARNTLVNYLQSHMIFSEGIKLNRHGVRIVALLGTTGVGKTTTLAKIAAKFVLENQVTAALITADTYRISAVEQLRTYSDILGLPLEIVYTPAELSKAIVKHRTKDLVLIDTAGRSQYNDYQMKELQELLSINQRIEKHLVLSVTTKQADAKDIIEKFSVCEPDKIIFTKTDETATVGSIMNLLMKQQRLAMSYFSNGQSVPDDIVAASPESLADLLLRS